MKNLFKKGIILGGLLGVIAVVGLAMSKNGKVLSEETQKDLKNLAKHLKKNLHKLEDVTKESYNDLVAKAVEEYAEKKETAVDIKEAFVTTLQEMWHEMEEEYLAEKDEEGK